MPSRWRWERARTALAEVGLDGSRIAADLAVEFPAPRRHGTPESVMLCERLLARLGVEVPSGQQGIVREPGGSRLVSADALTKAQVAGVPHDETPKGVH
ncbi:hypothetical protein [Streptomyces sp. NEAU-YJ-81]|uniref:hypothetical protein n=1 Tax=Streptomyces sp. NEAU-YJ-81 TaxID=2820288 RepID=UPI001ABBFEC9|nr:hypothetical protein [Streptomyces sp. NEAU-YJ-81]MBO3680304.1 hypothetical protein [Streptomyces sp. NEAU-YJ-81]